MAVSTGNKRKLVYKERVFYWYVRKNREGIPRLYILSGDKKVHLERPLFDTEVPVTPADVVKQLEEYESRNEINLPLAFLESIQYNDIVSFRCLARNEWK